MTKILHASSFSYVVKIIIALYSFMLYNICITFSMKLKSNNNVIYSCKYHVVWCPKYRRKVLIGLPAQRLKEIIQQAIVEYKAELIELEIMPDHVRLLVEVDPQFGIHRLIKLIKGRTSRLLRNEFKQLKSRLPTLWTNSYFVATVGGAPLSIIKQYIENQKNV
jgi:putative transposase